MAAAKNTVSYFKKSAFAHENNLNFTSALTSS